jgi:hypothetical protein
MGNHAALSIPQPANPEVTKQEEAAVSRETNQIVTIAKK